MYTHLNENELTERLRHAGHPDYHEEPFPQFLGRPPRPAAVLVPLTRVDGEWQVLYTRRTDIVEHHKRQVSFPGGATEAGDGDAEATALREADEEIGLHADDVQVLGKLGEMLTVSNFLITPVVAVFPWPYTFKVHTIEVERVFMLPLRWLADRENWQEFTRISNPARNMQGSGVKSAEVRRSMICYFPYDSELLWGVSARITVEFLRAISLLPLED
jgi:8-oxo-dGTP pyrophosphatase MutT (NUDIX family)